MDSRIEIESVDNVKIEKARAMMRYRRLRNVTKLFRMLELCVALTFLSWSSIRFPFAFTLFSGEYFLKLSVYLFSPNVAFLIGNAIIVGLYLLSRQNDAAGDHVPIDLYEEYIQHSETRLRTSGEIPTPPPEKFQPSPESEETIGNDKQIENADAKSKCDAVEAAIKQATKEIKRFQRTQSEKLKRELRVKPRAELRRSETDIHRMTIPAGDEREIESSETVEDLNNDEFRRTVETFIEQQRLVWTEKMFDKSTTST